MKQRAEMSIASTYSIQQQTTVPLELNQLELQKWNTCKQYWSQTQNMQEKSPGMETAIKMTPCNTMRYLNQLKMTTQFL